MAKKFSKWFAESHVCNPMFNHDNYHFTNNALINDSDQSKQHITFCELKAQNQNGIAKQLTDNIEEEAQKQLLHRG